MSVPTPVPAPVVKGGLKGKIFTFKQLARKNSVPDAEIEEAVTSFETLEDVESAMQFFSQPALDKVLPKDDKAKDDKKPAIKAVANAGTPPDQLPGSKATDVPRFARFNTNAIENHEHMNLVDLGAGKGAPMLRFNERTQQYEVL